MPDFFRIDGVPIPIAENGATERIIRAGGLSRRWMGNLGRSIRWEVSQYGLRTPLLTNAEAMTLRRLTAMGREVTCDGSIIDPAGGTLRCRILVTEGAPVTTQATDDGTHVMRTWVLEVHPVNEPLLFAYVPQRSIADATYSRASTATYRTEAGLLATAAAGVLRNSHYVLNPVTGLYERSTRIEGSRANLCYRSEADSGWTAAGTTPPTVDDTAAVVDGITCTQTTFPAITGGSYTACRAVGTSSSGMLFNGAEQVWSKVLRLSRALTADETIHVYVTGSSALQNVAISSANSASYDRTWGEVNGLKHVVGGPSGAGFFAIYAVKLLSPLTVYSSRRQVEVGPFSTSYIPNPGTGAVTRAADSYSQPFPWAPQEMTLYAKFIERGTAQLAASTFGLVGISGIGNRLGVWGSTVSAGAYRVEYFTASGSASAHNSNPVAIGDLVEVIVTLYSSGAVKIGVTKNGGALVESGVSSAPAGGLASPWGVQTAFVGARAASTSSGFAAFLAVKIAKGVKSLDQMRLLPPVS